MIIKYLEHHWQKRSALVAFGTGILATIIAFLVASSLFRYQQHLIGITTIFFTVILVMPLLGFILQQEERIEKHKGSFLKKNGKIIDFFVYFFFGTFVAFLVLTTINPHAVFSHEDFFNIKNTVSSINVPGPLYSNSELVQQILTNNLYLAFVAVMLSLLFGAGAIFVLVLNASMAAALLASLVSASTLPVASAFVCNASIFAIHFIPEMIGLLIAAIAGGILYIDFAKERLLSKQFDAVLKNAIGLFVLATCAIIIGAILEVYVSTPLFADNSCSQGSAALAVLLALLVAGVLFIERIRRHHSRLL